MYAQKMGIFHGSGIWQVPVGLEILETWEIPEIREFPGNFRMGNSLEKKFEAIRAGGNVISH